MNTDLTHAASAETIRQIKAARADRKAIKFVPASQTRAVVAIAYDRDGGDWPRAIYRDGSCGPAAFEDVCRFLEVEHP